MGARSRQGGVVDRPAIVHLVGTPAVGKLTVAEALAAGTGPDDPGRLVVVDNHLSGDPVLRVTPRGEHGTVPARAWAHVAEIRAVVRRAIVELSPAGWAFAFTNVLRDGDPLYEETVGELRALASARGAPYVPVVLRCERAEQLRRVTTPGRRARHKWTDVEGVARYLDAHQLQAGLGSQA